MKSVFAAEKLSSLAVDARQAIYAQLLDAAAAKDDTDLESVSVDKSGADWYCSTEERRWMQEKSDNLGSVVAWGIVALVDGGTAFGLVKLAAWADMTIVTVAVWILMLAFAIPIGLMAMCLGLGSAWNLARLHWVGHSEVAPSIMQSWAKATWALGKDGIYLPIARNPGASDWCYEGRFVPYRDALLLIKRDVRGMSMLRIATENDGIIAQMIFPGDTRRDIDDVAMEIQRRIHDSRPPPPGPRKRRRPPMNRDRKTPVFLCPISRYSPVTQRRRVS